MSYAKATDVAVDRTRAQIEKALDRYGADAFSYARDQTRAQIQFRMEGKQIRFELTLPDPQSDEFRLTPSGKWERLPRDAQKAWEQACRQRWRALLLQVTAMFAAIEAGITTFEEAFLAFIVLPEGNTVGEFMLPQVARAYETGEEPKMLPGA